VFVVIEDNASRQNISYECRVNSSDGNQSLSMPIQYDSLMISNLTKTPLGHDTVRVQFTITNSYLPQNVEWNLTVDGQTFESSAPTLLDWGDTLAVSQDVTFASGGRKPILVVASSEEFITRYEDGYRLRWLTIEQFVNTIKNNTARVLTTLIKNTASENTTVNWTTVRPGLGSVTNTSANESLFVIIEEAYSQGKKEHTISVYNSSRMDDRLVDVFHVHALEIAGFDTVAEDESRVITSATVRNNADPVNFSWSLQSRWEVLNASQPVGLQPNEEVFVVIDSSNNDSGVYELLFSVNDSTARDNVTRVVVS